MSEGILYTLFVGDLGEMFTTPSRSEAVKARGRWENAGHTVSIFEVMTNRLGKG